MLEPALGRLRFGLIYAVSLLTGSLGALLVSPHALTVGASGAVFGLMGAAAVEMRARQIPLMQSGVGGLILHQPDHQLQPPGISWGGHVGGLIGGALAAAPDAARRPPSLAGARARRLRSDRGGVGRGVDRQRPSPAKSKPGATRPHDPPQPRNR